MYINLVKVSFNGFAILFKIPSAHCEYNVSDSFPFQAASRDREQTEIFRLGVQKCKKIIYDCVPPKPEIFQGDGIDVLFKMLSALYEGRELSDIDKETMTLPAK